jgi:hypothetical protein
VPANGSASSAGAAADGTFGRPSADISTVWFPPAKGPDRNFTSLLAIGGDSECLLHVIEKVVTESIKAASPMAAAAERRRRRAQMRGIISLKS